MNNHFRKTSSAPAKDAISWMRIDNDTNGNPRYVCHWVNLKRTGEEITYDEAVARANTIGGRKYHTKRYGGGIVFQSFNLADTERSIHELINLLDPGHEGKQFFWKDKTGRGYTNTFAWENLKDDEDTTNWDGKSLSDWCREAETGEEFENAEEKYTRIK